MIAAVPRRLPKPFSGGHPLDPDRPAPDETRSDPGRDLVPGPDAGDASAPPAGGAGDTPTESDLDARPDLTGAEPGAPRRPRGLKRQVGATKDALLTLVRAHVNLAKAEASEIGDEVKVVAAAVGLAIGALILVAFLLPIGVMLFLGEWLFGSLGWGVLHGTELLILMAVAGVLAVLGAGRVGRSIVLGFLAGVLVAILFGTNAPNLLYTTLAAQFPAGTDPGPVAILVGAVAGAVIVGLLGAIAGARNGTAGEAFQGLVGGVIIGAGAGALAGGIFRLAQDEGSRPMVVGLLLVGGVAGIAGLILGAMSGGVGGALTGLVVSFVAGAAIGAFSAITFTWHVAIAIGIAVFLALAVGLMLADVAARGIDTEALKKRFYPERTIETTKETIEWAKARIPRGPRS